MKEKKLDMKPGKIWFKLKFEFKCKRSRPVLQHYHYQDGISRPESKHITTFDLNELMKIKVTDSNIRNKQLSFRTAWLISEFKLNRRKRGSRGGQDKKTYQNIEKPRGIIWQNLRTVPCIPYRGVKHTGKLWLMLLNTQSIKNKEDLLTDYSNRNMAYQSW